MRLVHGSGSFCPVSRPEQWASLCPLGCLAGISGSSFRAVAKDPTGKPHLDCAVNQRLERNSGQCCMRLTIFVFLRQLLDLTASRRPPMARTLAASLSDIRSEVSLPCYEKKGWPLNAERVVPSSTHSSSQAWYLEANLPLDGMRKDLHGHTHGSSPT